MESLVGADGWGGRCSRRQRRPLSIEHMQQHKAHAITLGVRGCVCVCTSYRCMYRWRASSTRNTRRIQACISPALASAAFFTSRRFLGLLLTGKTAKVKPQPSLLRPEVAVDDWYVLLVNVDSLDALPKASVSHKQGEKAWLYWIDNRNRKNEPADYSAPTDFSTDFYNISMKQNNIPPSLHM
jgi:hypothetical protein